MFTGCLVLVVYVIWCLLGGQLLAWLLQDYLDANVADLARRSAFGLALISLYPVYRWLPAKDLGLAEVARRDALLRGFALGLLLILPPMVAFLGLGFRVWDPRLPSDPVFWSSTVLQALISGLAVGLIEEFFFRGWLLGWLGRFVTPISSALMVSAAYATVHFIEMPASAAMVTLADAFGAFSNWLAELPPWQHGDVWLGLFAVGLLLAALRLNRASLWLCIGCHGAWVASLRLYKDVTVRDVENSAAWLAGSYDNFVGWLTLAWILLLAWPLWRMRARLR